MPTIAYEKWRPGRDAIEMIEHANEICSDYARQGYDLTLRQLYYQFVARGLIANQQKEYNRLGSVINRARLSGLLDWNYITDRTRNLESLPHWNRPTDIIDAAARSFRLDKWANQPIRVEVWVEKEALAGVVAQVADRHDVAYFACRGYVSQSEQWAAAQRHLNYLRNGQAVVVLHLGDHDPSGIDMTRDIEDRLHKFIYSHWAADQDGDLYSYREIEADMMEHVSESHDEIVNMVDMPHEIRRIALNMDQVEQYDPPPNPAKLTDSRVESYLAEYGDESWELDALPPDVLDALIEERILALRDDEAWEEMEANEGTHRELLGKAADRWDELVEVLRG